MKTNQPIWKQVAQLGDVNPIEYGGVFVYEDTTGVYAPECAVLIAPDDDSGKWIEYRFILEPCTFINGILSDNPYHQDHSVWFQDRMGEMCNCCGINLADFVDMITKGNTVNRALAWQAVGEYFGYDELDQYPNTFTREEIEKRYPKETWRI